MSEQLATLRLERRALHRQACQLWARIATAQAWGLPHLEDLNQEAHALYDQLAALDLRIASYDPQASLFDDLQPSTRR